MNSVPAAAMLVAFCCSPGLPPPKSPIAAKLNAAPGAAAVRRVPVADTVPLRTVYG